MSIFDHHLDYGGDPYGAQRREDQKKLAAEGDNSHFLYDDADQYRTASFDQTQTLPPYTGSPLGQTGGDQGVVDTNSQSQMQTAPQITKSIVTGAPQVAQPAPKKQGFFGRIGAGLKSMWSGIRSLFGGRRQP